MIKPLLIFTLLLLFTLLECYSLTGSWDLKNLNGQPTNHSLAFDIYESVTTDHKIKYYLEFSQCQNILYQVSVSENVMKIDQEDLVSKNGSQKNASNTCSDQEKTLEAKIAETLKYVFFFTIKNDLLVFIHPEGKQLLEFSRIKKIYLTSVVGRWQLDNVFWEEASHSIVEFRENNTAYFCEGKIEAKYETNYINEISFHIVKNDDCSQKNLTKALTHVKYYRIKDVELELYDEYSVEIIELFFVQGVMSMPKIQQKVISTKEQEQKYTDQGGIIIVDFNSKKEQVTSQLQPYLRTQDHQNTSKPQEKTSSDTKNSSSSNNS